MTEKQQSNHSKSPPAVKSSRGLVDRHVSWPVWTAEGFGRPRVSPAAVAIVWLLELQRLWAAVCATTRDAGSEDGRRRWKDGTTGRRDLGERRGTTDDGRFRTTEADLISMGARNPAKPACWR